MISAGKTGIRAAEAGPLCSDATKLGTYRAPAAPTADEASRIVAATCGRVADRPGILPAALAGAIRAERFLRGSIEGRGAIGQMGDIVHGLSSGDRRVSVRVCRAEPVRRMLRLLLEYCPACRGLPAMAVRCRQVRGPKVTASDNTASHQAPWVAPARGPMRRDAALL